MKKILSKILAMLATLWLRSLRIKVEPHRDFGPGILGLWHQDLLASLAAFKGKDVHILVSQSQDGEILTQVAKNLKYRISRGSDTRGSSNVRHLLSTLQKNEFVGMALDGPKGPAKVIKPGSLWLAEKGNRPLWHLQPVYGAHFKLKSWDNLIIPLPLSNIVMRINYFVGPGDKQVKKE